MKKILLLIMLLFVITVIYSIDITNGNIQTNTTWTLTNSPYNIHCNITIGTFASLTIQPGVVVKFDENRQLIVYGGLKAEGSSDRFVTFESAANDLKWKGIYLYSSFMNIFTFCNIKDVSGKGALQFNACTNILIQNCLIHDNIRYDTNNYTLQQAAGALFESCDNIQLKNNKFYNNTTPINTIPSNDETCQGNAVAFYNCTNILFENNEVCNNLSETRVGGITIFNSLGNGTNWIKSNIIRNNSAKMGGGIFVLNIGGDSKTLIENNTIKDNYSLLSGGGIFAYGLNIHIINNTISQNISGYSGGGVYLHNTTSEYTTNYYNNFLTSNNITKNCADYGAGVYVQNGAYNYSKCLVKNNLIDSNFSETITSIGGGGISLWDRNLH